MGMAHECGQRVRAHECEQGVMHAGFMILLRESQAVATEMQRCNARPFFKVVEVSGALSSFLGIGPLVRDVRRREGPLVVEPGAA